MDPLAIAALAQLATVGITALINYMQSRNATPEQIEAQIAQIVTAGSAAAKAADAAWDAAVATKKPA